MHVRHQDDVIKWKHFPHYWPFVRGIHRSPVNSPHKGQWRGALMSSLICDWINSWVNNREAGDLRRYMAHYDVIVMTRPQWVKSPLMSPISEFAQKPYTILSIGKLHNFKWNIACHSTQTSLGIYRDIYMFTSLFFKFGRYLFISTQLSSKWKFLCITRLLGLHQTDFCTRNNLYLTHACFAKQGNEWVSD